MFHHDLYIITCLELAEKAKGSVAPNPMVGALLVHEGIIIGKGWHQQYGQRHAEVNCLESVGEGDKHLIPESTMYVNLEPCSHYGKTPPCALRLVEEKVKQVIICNRDSFEKVSGKGIDILNQNNIATNTGVLEENGRWLNRRFFCLHEQKRPYIILKWAQTENGYFAPVLKERHQLSNKHSQQLVHKWRTEEASILVGTNTALNDDPRLTSRLWKGKQPLRLVIDKDLTLANSLKIFNNEANTWIINNLKDEQRENLRFMKADFNESIPKQILRRLHEANILSLIVEGGAALLNSFIEQDLWDEARIFVTPGLLDKGIEAPKLHHSKKAFSSDIASDTLQVYIHKNSKYPYVTGMQL